MAKAATKREAKKTPGPGSFWQNGIELFRVTYSREGDDVLYVENCRSNESMQMRLEDWHRCKMTKVKPA